MGAAEAAGCRAVVVVFVGPTEDLPDLMVECRLAVAREVVFVDYIAAEEVVRYLRETLFGGTLV